MSEPWSGSIDTSQYIDVSHVNYSFPLGQWKCSARRTCQSFHRVTQGSRLVSAWRHESMLFYWSHAPLAPVSLFIQPVRLADSHARPTFSLRETVALLGLSICRAIHKTQDWRGQVVAPDWPSVPHRSSRGFLQMSSRRERCMGFNYTHRATAARTSYWLEIFALHSTTLEDRKSSEHKFGKGQNQVLNAGFANLYSPYVKRN